MLGFLKVFLAMALITVYACGVLGDPLNGRWAGKDQNGAEIEMRFNNGKLETSTNGHLFMKGTYTTNNGELLQKITHFNGKGASAVFEGAMVFEERWYPADEFLVAFRNEFRKLPRQGMPERIFEEQMNQLVNGFASMASMPPAPYSIDGKKLTLANGTVLHRR
ncbi:MAG: hypothetical protein FWE23_01435 [Chitinivibrionia bacterium]|nr:hypothetical protein [Chitinivibrionia bacterium]